MFGAIALAFWLRIKEEAPPLSRWLWWPALLLPCYVAFQLVPFPSWLLEVLSPARTELANALTPLGLRSSPAPLNVVPSIGLEHFTRITAYVLTFLLIRQLAWRYVRHPWMVTFPLIGLAAVEALVGLIQYNAVTTPEAWAHGTFTNKNHFAGFLEMALPFAVMYPFTLIAKSKSRHDTPGSPALKACLIWSVAALIFVGILYSLSRMGFLACLGSMLVMGVIAFWRAAERWKRWASVGLTVVTVVLIFIFLPPQRFFERFVALSGSEEISADSRKQIWRETLNLIAAYPVFGCGLGGYESAFPKYKVALPMYTINYAHNDYLQLMAELGIPVFVLGLAFFAGLLWLAVRSACAARAGESLKPLALACVGSLTAISLHSFTDFNLYIPANAILLFWIGGITASLSFLPSSQPSHGLPRRE